MANNSIIILCTTLTTEVQQHNNKQQEEEILLKKVVGEEAGILTVRTCYTNIPCTFESCTVAMVLSTHIGDGTRLGHLICSEFIVCIVEVNATWEKRTSTEHICR